MHRVNNKLFGNWCFEQLTLRHQLQSTRKSKLGFSLVELMTTVAIIGILAAIAAPMYSRYIRRARTSEAISNLGAIAMYQETFFAESTSYTSAGANPPGTVPTTSDPGGRKNFSAAVSGWNLLGRVIPDGTPVYFQYEVRAGQFGTVTTTQNTGGLGSLVRHDSTSIPGGSSCSPQLAALSGASLSIPAIANSNWFYATAVGNQRSGGRCSLFIKAVDRPDIYKENETE